MAEVYTAKVVKDGEGQSLRLPKELRFSADEVYLSRDPATGRLFISEDPIGRPRGPIEMKRSVEIPVSFVAEHMMEDAAASGSLRNEESMG